jgi:heme-degrading monooxygenase HmoA
MYARITDLKVVPGKSKEATEGWARTIELAQGEAGFQEAVFILDETSHQGFSITFWDSKENLDRTSQRGAGTLIERAVPLLRGYLTADPRFSSFKVMRRIK